MRLRNAGWVHDRKFRERFPQLGDVRMEHRWAGMLCLSRNGSAAFGELDQGVYSPAARTGWASPAAPCRGWALRNWFAAGRLTDRQPFPGQPMPPKLPPEPFASLGANTYLMWKEWRSGKE